MIPTTDYTIDSALDTITFTSAPTNGSTIAVTTFNDTQQQYLNTQVITVGSSEVVNAIQSISNEISLPLAITRATASTAGSPNQITVDSTTGFAVNATVQFKGTSFGGLSTTGTVYFVDSIVSLTVFTIKNENGTQIVTTLGTGSIQVVVGGQPAVRVTTAAANGLSENDLVTIDGTLGSVQLNNNTYYAKIIDSTTFDLYESGIVGYTGYNPAFGAINYPITTISSYTSGGYVWLDETFVIVSEYNQDNVDRLWVTVNGYRVPPSSLVINGGDNLSILSPIISSDSITITSMIPSATPNQLVYLQNVNKNGIGSVYRANTDTRTWLIEPLYYTNETIYVSDITRITDSIVQNVVAPAAIDGIISIGLTADKNTISQVIVYNATTSSYVATSNYAVVIVDLAPELEITGGVTAGNNLVITTIEGNLIYINGEQIRFSTVDLVNNTISGLQRGSNGTGILDYIPKYSEVFGVLSNNLLPSVNYNLTWNSNIYNATDGDPLQISETNAAIFLNSGVS
jgi:hypothetical protein